MDAAIFWRGVGHEVEQSEFWWDAPDGSRVLSVWLCGESGYSNARDLPRGGLWLLPLRDALSFAVFLGSFCGRSVSWRDQLFRVEPSGQMSVERD